MITSKLLEPRRLNREARGESPPASIAHWFRLLQLLGAIQKEAETKVLSPIIADIARIACKRCQPPRNKAQSAGKHSDVDARPRALMGLMKTAP